MFVPPGMVRAETDTDIRSLVIGADEIEALAPRDGGFVLPGYGVRLIVPEQWRDSVLLTEMHVTRETGVMVVYGLLFYPPDIEVTAVQYLGALMVCDRELWRDDGTERMLKLATTDDCVFVFLNSLFSLYDGLPETARFEELALSDDMAAAALKIESLKLTGVTCQYGGPGKLYRN